MRSEIVRMSTSGEQGFASKDERDPVSLRKFARGTADDRAHRGLVARGSQRRDGIEEGIADQLHTDP
jgi:hypothetical protein